MKRLKLDIQKFGSASAQSDSYEGRYLKVTFTETGTSIADNTSTVQWTLESTGGSSTYYTIHNCRVTVTYAKNSGTSTVTENVCDYGTTYWDSYRFPAKKGSVSGTITVKHKDDGTALPVDFTLHGRVYWDGDNNRSNSLNLTTIPRYATANQSFNSKTETTIKMNWSSDNTCDYIWYSTNNGSSWTAVGSVNSTNGSYTISGLSANTTYQIKTKVRRKDSQLTTESSKLDIATYDYPKLDTNGGPDFYIESPVTLTIYNPRGHNCTVIVYDKNGNEIGSTTTSTTTAGPFLNDNTSKLRMYGSIPNNPEGRYSVKVNITGHTGSTLSGGLYKASSSLCEPTFTDYRLRDVDEDTRLLTGDNTVQIVGYSDMAAIIPAEDRAEPNNGASMSYYRFIIGNSSPVDVTYSYDRDVSAILNNAPAGSCKVYAYDSRGFSKLVEKTPQTILYYTDITRGPISIVRQNGNIGEAVTLTFSGTFWNEDFGNVHNAITSSNITYQYKKTTDSTWSPGSSTISPTTTQGSNDYSFSGSILGDTNNGFDTRYSYNIEVTVSDKLSSTTFSVILGSGSPGLAVHDSGIAVKQPYDTTDDSVLQVNGKAKIKGTASVTKNVAIPKDSTAGYGITNSDGTSVLRNGANTNTILDATGGGLYLGYANTNNVDILNGKAHFTSNGLDFRNNNSGAIEWKENGYGDKFRIKPEFGGTDDSNKLQIQGTVGGSGTDPSNWVNLLTISGKSGILDANNFNYSTNEIAVGKWIDGKVIYRKVYKITSGISANVELTLNVSSLNINRLIKLEGFTYSSEFGHINLNFFNGDHNHMFYNMNNDKKVHYQYHWNTSEVYIILEYTKN